MSITHSITRQWTGTNGTPITPAAQAFTGNEEINFDFALAGNTTNEQHPLAFTKTLMQVTWIYTDAEDITVKTNSSSAPQDTITVKAGEPLIWDINSPLTCPFSGNVTTAYFTNATGTSTNVKIRCLTNG